METFSTSNFFRQWIGIALSIALPSLAVLRIAHLLIPIISQFIFKITILTISNTSSFTGPCSDFWPMGTIYRILCWSILFREKLQFIATLNIGRCLSIYVKLDRVAVQFNTLSRIGPINFFDQKRKFSAIWTAILVSNLVFMGPLMFLEFPNGFPKFDYIILFSIYDGICQHFLAGPVLIAKGNHIVGIFQQSGLDLLKSKLCILSEISLFIFNCWGIHVLNLVVKIRTCLIFFLFATRFSLFSNTQTWTDLKLVFIRGVFRWG